jgi:uncharacterized membrane protein
MQTLSVNAKATAVQVPLVSPIISDLVATDQNGSPLSYQYSPGGENITVYTLGATLVKVDYGTGTLTGKNGTVWTLTFGAKYNSTVVLPQFATVESISGTPYSFNQTDSYPELALSAGEWRISYGVPFESTSGTGTTSTGTSGTPTGVGQVGPPGSVVSEAEWEAVVAAVAAVGGALTYWFWKRRELGPVGAGLRPDDLQVLNFIRDKGGKVLEPEIRMKFALPKTSAWRQIKRLERMGYVKVTKIGSQNQIELLKDRSST